MGVFVGAGVGSARAVSGSIALDGTPVTVSITGAGANGHYTFAGATGQRVFVELTGSTFGPACPAVALSLVRPDKSKFVAPVTTCGPTAVMDTRTLDQDGTWTVFVDPQHSNVGTATLRAWSVPPDQTAPIMLDDVATAVNLGTPGQNGAFHVHPDRGAVGRGRGERRVVHGACPPVVVALLRPDATQAATANVCSDSAFIEATPIDQAGTWTVRVDPQSDSKGSLDLQVFDATEQQGTAMLDGTPLSVALSEPGQNGAFTFTGTVGQKISATVASATFPGCPAYTLALVRPDGSTLGTPADECGDSRVPRRTDRSTRPAAGASSSIRRARRPAPRSSSVFDATDQTRGINARRHGGDASTSWQPGQNSLAAVRRQRRAPRSPRRSPARRSPDRAPRSWSRSCGPTAARSAARSAVAPNRRAWPPRRWTRPARGPSSSTRRAPRPDPRRCRRSSRATTFARSRSMARCLNFNLEREAERCLHVLGYRRARRCRPRSRTRSSRAAPVTRSPRTPRRLATRARASTDATPRRSSIRTDARPDRHVGVRRATVRARGERQLQAYTFTDLTAPADLSGKALKLGVRSIPARTRPLTFTGTRGQQDLHGARRARPSPATTARRSRRRCSVRAAPRPVAGPDDDVHRHRVPRSRSRSTRSARGRLLVDPQGANTGTVTAPGLHRRRRRTRDHAGTLQFVHRDRQPGTNAPSTSRARRARCGSCHRLIRRPSPAARAGRVVRAAQRLHASAPVDGCDRDLVLGPGMLDATGTVEGVRRPAGTR